MSQKRQDSGDDRGSKRFGELSASIDLTPVATVITDNRQFDNPIVSANTAFYELTGYSEDEVLGRNCRFLAGPATLPLKRSALRAAIAAGSPTLVKLMNYRKDGSRFLNAVMIAPVLDPRGRVAYFIGSQMEVSSPHSSNQDFATDLVLKLTARQRHVLRHMANGHRNRKIAELLGIGERTVKMHRAKLLQSLGVATSADAIRMGVEAKLHVSEK